MVSQKPKNEDRHNRKYTRVYSISIEQRKS